MEAKLEAEKQLKCLTRKPAVCVVLLLGLHF